LKLKSPVLKLALFATGFSGVVAEYILSTLATYFLGDAVFQWTMIVSMMLFSMGLGSRFSKYITSNLLAKFITIELLLSVLVSFASLLAYTSAGYTNYTGFIIYALSIAIGTLIGLEIPLVIRINKDFESLKVNISSVLENDYWGSLAGGVFFAFIGLPFLGLTYTPFVLGLVNFSVALILLFVIKEEIRNQKLFYGWSLGVFALIITGFFVAEPLIIYGEQHKYKDKIVYSEQSKYQRIVLTQWKNEHWLYLNGNQQLSSIDEDMYHEPLVHPAMKLAKHAQNVLILGGGDGCAAREVLKHKSVKDITIVDLDPAMTRLASTNSILTDLNEHALSNEKVTVINQDGFTFLTKTAQFFDVIIIDLPDPKSVDLNRLYTREFYQLCARQLRPNGVVVTQAGSPYFATKAFECIHKTITAAGFSTAAMHNQILTMGEWGWIIGTKATLPVKEKLKELEYKDLNTNWINNEAMQLMTSFGKNVYLKSDEKIEINTIQNPVLYRYYLKGNWDLY
jgi:spermidine synthase